jgi:hypothetical protein
LHSVFQFKPMGALAVGWFPLLAKGQGRH